MCIRDRALEVCKDIKHKGYKLFVQPVDIMGYTDKELIEFLELVNELEPYCISIVDTFGSMYQEDLHRVFEIINHNLIDTCKIGFHSHNNMQLSNALSQEFIRMTVGKREVIIDGTISGMGRGAGNTPTELIAQYMGSKLGYPYDMDVLLDLIDTYMDGIRNRCTWGYTTQYFVAGCYSAHVNNISYLSKKNSIRSKDIRYILNRIGTDARKRYDYDLLDKTYLELLSSDVDDLDTMEELRCEMKNRSILILAPGSTITTHATAIQTYIDRYKPIVISVNFVSDDFQADYIYMSNTKRYRYWKTNNKFASADKIITSNLLEHSLDEHTKIVSFIKLIKCGWECMDNSCIMLLRLLDNLGVDDVSFAGFDGYDPNGHQELNYVSQDMELSSVKVDSQKINKEITEMLIDFVNSRRNQNMRIHFVTPSRFEQIVN